MRNLKEENIHSSVKVKHSDNITLFSQFNVKCYIHFHLNPHIPIFLLNMKTTVCHYMNHLLFINKKHTGHTIHVQSELFK